MRRLLVALGIGILCMHAPIAGAKEKASATIKLSAGSVAAGIGVSWGSGTLSYHGKSYPISVNGLDVGSVGATKLNANGSVYHLKSLDDFNGTYSAVAAGATAGAGGSVLAMQNQNGVVVHLVSTSRGVNLTLGPSGVKMELKHHE